MCHANANACEILREASAFVAEAKLSDKPELNSVNSVLDTGVEHARYLGDQVYTATVDAFKAKRPQVNDSFFPKHLPMAETEALASSVAADVEDWIGLANIFHRHDVQQAVCLQALDQARISYAKCMVMQATRLAPEEGAWKAPDSIGSFSACADRLATELRNLTKHHEDHPVKYDLFPPEDADGVLAQLHERTKELFKVESRFLDSALTALHLHICSLVPQDDWNVYLVETPDKSRIKQLMESESTMKIGKATRQALLTLSSIKDWSRLCLWFVLFCFFFCLFVFLLFEKHKDWILQHPVVELKPWLEKRTTVEKGTNGEKDIEPIFDLIPKEISRSRMLLSVVNAWNCILVKANSKKVQKGELSKKEIIEDCKKRIKKVDCWKDFENTMQDTCCMSSIY